MPSLFCHRLLTAGISKMLLFCECYGATFSSQLTIFKSFIHERPHFSSQLFSFWLLLSIFANCDCCETTFENHFGNTKSRFIQILIMNESKNKNELPHQVHLHLFRHEENINSKAQWGRRHRTKEEFTFLNQLPWVWFSLFLFPSEICREALFSKPTERTDQTDLVRSRVLQILS